MNRTEESFSKKNKRVASSLDISQPASSAAAATTTERIAGPVASSGIFSNTFLIILVIILLVFPAIGFIVISILGNTYDEITETVSPALQDFLKFFGYSTGTIINKSADVAADVAKTGIDIAQGSIRNVGNLVQGKPGDDNDRANRSILDETIQKKVDTAIEKKLSETERKEAENRKEKGEKEENEAPKKEPESKKSNYKNPADAQPDTSENAIQKPITSDKIGWCLIGEYANKRGCVSVAESDQCLSGQIFPSKEMCLNPTLTP